MLVNDWTTCLCLMAVSSESIFQTPNAALSGRGERTRAAGPLGRRVGQALRTTAPLEFDQPPLSQIALDLRHRLFIRNASDRNDPYTLAQSSVRRRCCTLARRPWLCGSL